MGEVAKVRRWAIDSAISYRSFVITILAYLFILNLLSCYFFIPFALRGRPDFRHLYAAGYMVRAGYADKLYDGETNLRLQTQLAGPLNIPLTFNHLAYEALIFAPLSLLKFRTAYLVFFGINLALLIASFLMLKPYIVSLSLIWRWLPQALFVCFYPIAIALIQGQDSIILVTLLIGAFVSLQKGNEWRAGVLVGLTLFKLQFGIPIFVMFVAWKWWRGAAGFLVSGMAVMLVSLGIAGLPETSVYLRSLLSMSVTLKTAQQQDFYGIHPDTMPNLRGVFTALGEPHMTHSLVQIATIACSAALLALAARSRPSFPLAVLVSFLVSYHGLIHDASILVIPIALLGAASVVGEIPWAQWTAVLAGVIVILPGLLTQTGGRAWLVGLPILALTVVHLVQSRRGRQFGVRQAIASPKVPEYA